MLQWTSVETFVNHLKEKIATLRFNLRIKIRDITLFVMVARTQTLHGVNSLVETKGSIPEAIHIVMWDLEGCTLEQAKQELRNIKYMYGLGVIYVVGDTPYSYRAWCFTRVTFMKLLDILIHTRYVDWNFIYWTFHRAKATLRLSTKQDRQPQQILAIIKDDWEQIEPIPDNMQFVTYDTGRAKRGITLLVRT